MSKNFSRKFNKFIGLSTHPLYLRGLIYGVAAAIEHESMIRSLRLGALIDIGANTGQFSLLTRRFHATIPIHALEPLPSAAAKYESLFSHDPGVYIYRIAAGELAGEADIHVSGRPDSSSLLPITELQNSLFPGTSQASLLKIKVGRVDDLLMNTALPDPIFIKLDVQGYELSALKGMPALLKRAQYVYSEVSFKELYKGQPLAHEVVAWLANAGFQLTGTYNLTTAEDGTAVQADFLFTQDIERLGRTI